MDGYAFDTTRPASASDVKTRLFSVSDVAEVWAVWANTAARDDLLGFAVSPDGHHWVARGYGETYNKQVSGFPSRKDAVLFLLLTGGVKPPVAEAVEMPVVGPMIHDARQAGLSL